MNRAIAALGLAGLLASCSGSSGAPQPAPPPAGNAPPAFTSAAAVTVPENSAGAIYQATASDPDGNPLTFALAGGPDAARFTITTAGALSFATPPDFEAPTDADTNNIYLVTLQVSDGTTSATLNLAVTIANVGPDGFRVARVGTGFSAPLFVVPVPDSSGRVFVVQQGGLIRILDPATGTIAGTPFLDVSAETTTDGERGLLGFATAPDFAASGVFYVFLTNPVGTIEIRRYRTLAGNRDRADPASGDLLLAVPHGTFSNHNGGWIGFGPDGFLYIGIGDGGGANDPLAAGQNRNTLLGKMLRIDVNSDAFPADPSRDYAIPPGNPFAAGGGSPEIWAFGLRNPFRNSFDPATGLLWIGDVGQNAREEIDLMRPTDGGANFGWSVAEGIANSQPGFTLPVIDYPHAPPGAASVTGGYVYRGPVEALRGLYVFGDFVTAALYAAPVARVSLGATLAGETLRRTDLTPNAGAINNVSSFGVDQAGNLYIVDYDGEIFRIEVQ